MRVNYVEAIAETPEQLRRFKKQQKTIVSFQKIQSLYLLKTGQIKTITKLATLVGVHRVTLQKWLKKYKNGGLEGLLIIKPKTGRPSQFNDKAITELEKILNEAENGFKSYEEIQQWLKSNCQLKIKYKTLYHWVRYRLKAKLKVPRRSAIKKNEQEEVEFKKN